MKPIRRVVTSVAAAAALWPALSFAHVGADSGLHHGVADALAAGFLHPFSGLDHLLAMVGLGLWSALSARRLWAAPLAFVTALLLGALLARAGFAMPAVEPMIAASLLVIGLLAATRLRLPTALGVLLAALFALFHGAAHGQELSGAYGAPALAAMVLATALLHVAGMGVGSWLQRRPLTARMVPLAGGGVALAGLAFLARLA